MESLSKDNIIIRTKNETLVRYHYEITVYDKHDQSHNINMSHPSFYTSAFCDAEAVGKMILSDFKHKYLPIHSINKY